jgi:hypothetical protein
LIQPAVTAPAINPAPFNRLRELLEAAWQDLGPGRPQHESPADRALRCLVGERHQEEARRLAMEAMTEGAAVGLPRDELKAVLGRVLLALHRLYSRDPGAESAYYEASGPLEVMIAEVRGRARQFANAPAPATAVQAPALAATASSPAPAGAEAATENPPEERPTRQELNKRAGEYLLKHRDREARGQRSGRVTLEELARAIGCSMTAAAGLPAWKTIQLIRKQKDKGALNQLIQDQLDNDEPSPTEDDPPDHARKVWASRS